MSCVVDNSSKLAINLFNKFVKNQKYVNKDKMIKDLQTKIDEVVNDFYTEEEITFTLDSSDDCYMDLVMNIRDDVQHILYGKETESFEDIDTDIEDYIYKHLYLILNARIPITSR